MPQPSDPELTSLSLLDRARADDPEAWRRLVHLYSPLVYSWGRRAGLGPEDTADMMQEVFRSVSGHLQRFRHDRTGDTFRGWLWTIARNKLHDFGRRKTGRPVAVGGDTAQEMLLELPESEPSDASSQMDDNAGLIRRALDLIRSDFEPTSFQAFWRVAVDGLAPADAAAEAGLSVFAVYQAKYRILKRLRIELRELVE